MADQIVMRRAGIVIRLVKYWLPVAALLGAMFYASTDTFSDGNTRSVFEEIFLWFLPNASEGAIFTFNYVVRKSAHFCEYALLGALLFRAFRADNPLRWRMSWAIYSFGIALAWAALDEWHQSFTLSRAGTIRDTLLDSSGALFALIGLAIVNRTRKIK